MPSSSSRPSPPPSPELDESLQSDDDDDDRRRESAKAARARAHSTKGKERAGPKPTASKTHPRPKSAAWSKGSSAHHRPTSTVRAQPKVSNPRRHLSSDVNGESAESDGSLSWDDDDDSRREPAKAARGRTHHRAHSTKGKHRADAERVQSITPESRPLDIAQGKGRVRIRTRLTWDNVRKDIMLKYADEWCGGTSNTREAVVSRIVVEFQKMTLEWPWETTMEGAIRNWMRNYQTKLFSKSQAGNSDVEPSKTADKLNMYSQQLMSKPRAKSGSEIWGMQPENKALIKHSMPSEPAVGDGGRQAAVRRQLFEDLSDEEQEHWNQLALEPPTAEAVVAAKRRNREVIVRRVIELFRSVINDTVTGVGRAAFHVRMGIENDNGPPTYAQTYVGPYLDGQSFNQFAGGLDKENGLWTEFIDLLIGQQRLGEELGITYEGTRPLLPEHDTQWAIAKTKDVLWTYFKACWVHAHPHAEANSLADILNILQVYDSIHKAQETDRPFQFKVDPNASKVETGRDDDSENPFEPDGNVPDTDAAAMGRRTKTKAANGVNNENKGEEDEDKEDEDKEDEDNDKGGGDEGHEGEGGVGDKDEDGVRDGDERGDGMEMGDEDEDEDGDGDKGGDGDEGGDAGESARPRRRGKRQAEQAVDEDEQEGGDQSNQRKKRRVRNSRSRTPPLKTRAQAAAAQRNMTEYMLSMA
ncbi:hypothetical protein EVJ58_g8944 [Rhodofomes roseus]|uniref:Uncharacterized protein n=1 Tax=Rhodofomes roseus TaxID=34475 RepID=A0A4Y9XVY5_9APHY|nr:hypothetical protein EVJ58_g8944 [Rhodofomes roseus]